MSSVSECRLRWVVREGLEPTLGGEQVSQRSAHNERKQLGDKK